MSTGLVRQIGNRFRDINFTLSENVFVKCRCISADGAWPGSRNFQCGGELDMMYHESKESIVWELLIW